MKINNGYSLIELMISLAAASILSVGVVSTFTSQSAIYINQSQRTQSSEVGRDVYEILSRLLQQANQPSIDKPTDTNNLVVVEFTLPEGYSVWPNTTSPYTDNAIRIRWADDTNATNPNQITITKADAIADLDSATAVPLAGSNSGPNTRITHMSLTALGAGDYYRLVVKSRPGVNPNVVDTTYDGVILPRN